MLGLKQSLGLSKKKPATATGFADGYSIALDGTNDYFTADSAGSEIDGDIGSLSMWFNLDAVSANAFMFEAVVDANNRISVIYVNHSSTTYFEHEGGASENTISTTTTIENNGWHHLAYTWTVAGDATVAYLDGSSIGTSGCDNFTGTISSVNIGNRKDTAWSFFKGNINDVAVFDDVLTSGEVSTINNSGEPTDLSSHSGLVAYWQVENNTDDSSSNSNSITLVNGADYEAETP